MGTFEEYYHQLTALARVTELVGQGFNVWIRRDRLNGVPIWVVEWTR